MRLRPRRTSATNGADAGAGGPAQTRARTWLKRLTIAGLGGLVLVLGLVALAYATVDLPPEPPLAETSVVLDADGNELGRLHAEENRELVTLDEVADVMEQAVVAAEDRSFYDHSGLDPRGVVRAFWADVRGRPLQGGSTITQQLVKNSFLSRERSLVRKAQEALLALKLEQRWSKDRILERYLNTVYFGRGTYGVQAAAEAYFGVPASELQAPQAALLAGLIRAPEEADPVEQPEEAQRRRDQVLEAMVATEALSQSDADTARAGPVEAQPPAPRTEVASGGRAYFVEHVRQWAVEEFGEERVYGGGLRITTTLDGRMQDAAEAAVAEVLDQPDDPAAALVALDDTGAVRAMVGGRDFAASEVNYALGSEGGGTGRQAGSTFKPMVLAAALEEGVPLSQRFAGPPQISLEVGGAPWEVSNYGGEGYGQLDLIAATANSVNTVYAQLMAQVGPPKVVDVSGRLGITSPLDELPAIALGTEEVSPLEMTSAFMTFAQRGMQVTPFPVREVTDSDGQVVYRAEPEPTRAIDERYADGVNAALQQVIERGTASSVDIGVPACGKTGTTQDYGDAWFVGYTPILGAGVWMGYPEGPSRPMTDVHGRQVTGGSFPAEIWERFMQVAVEGLDTGEFVPPDEELLTGPTLPVPPPTVSGPPTSAAGDPSDTTVVELDDDGDGGGNGGGGGGGSTTSTTTGGTTSSSSTIAGEESDPGG